METVTYDIKEKLIGGRDFKASVMATQILNSKMEKELIVLALDKDHLLSNRAMWVVAHCSEQDYNRIKPFHVKLINNLKNSALHPGVVRSTLGLFQKNCPPPKYESFLLDKCYGYISNAAEAIAVRAFAITVVFTISKQYPELLEELKNTLIYLAPMENTPAMKARIKNTLKGIDKINSGKKIK